MEYDNKLAELRKIYGDNFNWPDVSRDMWDHQEKRIDAINEKLNPVRDKNKALKNDTLEVVIDFLVWLDKNAKV